MMKCRVKLILAAAALILSSIVAVNLLLVSAPVVIQIENETFKIIEIPYSYTTKDAHLLLLTGLIGGIAISQIIFCIRVPLSEVLHSIRDKVPVPVPDPETREIPLDNDRMNMVLRALEGDEREIVRVIMESGGEILQNELVNTLNFSKAKVSRNLMSLERRGIIKKNQYGLTNRIILADDIRGEPK